MVIEYIILGIFTPIIWLICSEAARWTRNYYWELYEIKKGRKIIPYFPPKLDKVIFILFWPFLLIYFVVAIYDLLGD